MIFCLLFSISALLVVPVSSATLPPIYDPPILNLTSRYSMTQGVYLNNPSGASYVQMVVTNSYVSRLTNSGKLEIFDIDSKQLKFNLFNSTRNPVRNSVRSYDIFDGSPLILSVILENNTVILYNLYQNASIVPFSQAQQVPYYRQGIQLFDDEYVMVDSGVYTNQEIVKRTKSINWAYNIYQIFATSIYTPVWNIKKCRVKPTDQIYKVAIWKRNCYVEVLKCTINQTCTSLYFENSTACDYYNEFYTSERDYFKLDWNKDCTKIMYESKNVGVKIVKISTKATVLSYSISYTGASLNGFWFMDDFDQYISLLWTDGRFEVYSIAPNLTKVDEKFVEQSKVAAYRRSRQILFVTNGTDLYAYNFTCNSGNFSLKTNGLCIPNPVNTTVTNTTINATTNIIANTITNSLTNPTTNSTMNSTINATNNQSNDSANQTSDINTEEQDNSSSKNVFNIIAENFYKNPFNEFVVLFFGRTQKFVTISLFLIQILPTASFFIRYVNFWFICTMYLIPYLWLPQNLKDVIYQIYKFINASIFQMIGIKLTLDTKITEKFSLQENQMFGFSSDIINSNIENVFITLISYMIVVLFYFFSRQIPKKSFLYRTISTIDYRIIILAQFVSMMHTFAFNFSIFTQKSYQGNFMEKFNMFLHNFLFNFSAFISCVVILMFEKRAESSKVEKQITKRERCDWFYDSQCHLLMSVITIMKSKIVFLVFNSIFFCIPIYTAIIQKKCRISFIIKSLYLPILNLGVIALQILKGKEMGGVEDVIETGAICIIFAGAVHELLEIAVSLIYSIAMLTCCNKSKITNSPETKVNLMETALQPDLFQPKIKREKGRVVFRTKIQRFSAHDDEVEIESKSFHINMITITPKQKSDRRVEANTTNSRMKRIKKVKQVFHNHYFQSEKIREQSILEEVAGKFPMKTELPVSKQNQSRPTYRDKFRKLQKLK